MEVKENNWISKAIDNVDKYLNRGGPLQGDIPECLKGTKLYNTIGIAMGLNMDDPNKWNNWQIQEAVKGDLCFFSGDNYKAIEVVAEQIYKSCEGDKENFITVLPIELYYCGKLYELPLFRTQRYKQSTCKFVDNIGRIYSSFDDWYENSKLPPCKMLYPENGHLKLREGFKYSSCYANDTPSNRTGATLTKWTDITSGVVGIGAATAGIFITGGLAAPFILGAGIVSATYGTARASYQVYDRGSHGESINPFTNSQSRALWLGIAASIVSFGAMGATMRFASLVAKGKNISTSLSLLVNITNGGSLTLNTAAIINSSVYLIMHIDDLSAADVLLQVASIAFWAKGCYQYKTAGAIKIEVRNKAIESITKDLPSNYKKNFAEVRQHVGDEKLLQIYHEQGKAGMSGNEITARLLLFSYDNNEVIGVSYTITNDGNIILGGQHEFKLDTLLRMNNLQRKEFYKLFIGLSDDSHATFKIFRAFVNDDNLLFGNIFKFSDELKMTPSETTEFILNAWKGRNQYSLPGTVNEFNINEGTLTIANNHKFTIQQLHHFEKLTTPFGQFLNDFIVPLNEKESQSFNLIRNHLKNDFELIQWVDLTKRQKGVSVLQPVFELLSHGLMSVCPVTALHFEGTGVLELNNQLKISVLKLTSNDMNYSTNKIEHLLKLNSTKEEKLKLLFKLVASVKDNKVCTDTRRIVVTCLRLRFEFQRNDAVTWFQSKLPSLKNILSNIESFEKDRLYMVQNSIYPCKNHWTTDGSLAFAVKMNPGNVGQLASYCEFALSYAHQIHHALKKANNFTPKGQLAGVIFGHQSSISDQVFLKFKEEFQRLQKLARDNNMIGQLKVRKGLSNQNLIKVIRENDMKFGTDDAAAYHICKHGYDFGEETSYVQNANKTIRDTSNDSCRPPTVTWSQGGDSRSITFDNSDPNNNVQGGKAIVIESNGVIRLATFM